MAERYLIDTSAVIKYLTTTLSSSELSLMDEIVDDESIISFISEIELQVWNPSDPADLEVYQLFVANSTIIGVDSLITREAIQIRKFYRIKLPDAIIAATAIVNDLILIADNDKDFKRIPELKYINPVNSIKA
jgi:predicted nucleic acid-binding protein